jgi:protein-disulfide isomerase
MIAHLGQGMTMTDRFERTMSGVLALAALGFAGVLIHREFRGGSQVAQTARSSPQRVDEWPELLAAGVVVGNRNAPVKIVEIADFECPYCRRFEERYQIAKRRFGDDVALVFVHYPLSVHRFAMPAARASQCAWDQGKFAEIHALIFAKQDSLGLKPWMSFAREAAVPDTALVARCILDTLPVKKIVAGQQMAGRLRVHGTPTVFLNGWRFDAVADDSLLPRLVAAARVGSDSLEKVMRRL